MVVSNPSSVEGTLVTYSTEKNYLEKVDKVVELTFRQIQQFVRQFKDLNKCGTELVHNLYDVYGDEESSQFSPGSLIGELLIPKLLKIQSHWNTQLVQLVDQLEQVTEKSLQEHQANTISVKQRVAVCETQKEQYFKKNEKWKKQAAKRTDSNYLQKFAEAEVAFSNILNQVTDDLQAFKEHKTANIDQSLYLLSSVCFSLLPDGQPSYSTTLAESRELLKKGQNAAGANSSCPVPMVEDRKTYLASLLLNPFGFRYFRKFMQSQHSQENIDFWQAVENYKLLKNQDHLNTQASEIFRMYFSDDNINISGKNKVFISEEMKLPKNREGTLFNGCQKEVFDGMLDPLERYLKSKAFTRMQARLATYPSTQAPLGSSQAMDLSEEEKRPIRKSFFDKRRTATETTSSPDFAAAKPKPAQLKRDTGSRSDSNLSKLNAERPTSTPPRSRKTGGPKRGSLVPPERVPLPNQWMTSSLGMALNLTMQGVSGTTATSSTSASSPSPLKQDTPSSATSTPAQSIQPSPAASPQITQRSVSLPEDKSPPRSLSSSASSNENATLGSDSTTTLPFLVKVAFDFKATTEDELELKQGQSVMVIDSNHPEWWLGELISTNKQGYFPSFYVYAEKTHGTTSASEEDPLAWTHKATVLYDYVKQEDNELSVTKGELLVIYKINDNEEWWEAEDKNGNVGFVPRVYCQVIQPTSES